MIRYGRPDPSEAEAFAALHVTCWKEAYRGLVPDRILDAATVETRLSLWQGVLAEPERIVCGAWDGKSAVGFIMAGSQLERLFDGVDGHVPALYIRRSHARQGIGRRLMGKAASQWLARGGKSLALGVLAGNAPARAFYEALGGRLVREDTYEWDDEKLPHAIYVFETLRELARFA